MADLVITLPKRIKWDDYKKEMADVADGRLVMNFKVPSRPKEATKGDRCWIVHNGYVQGYMLITDIVYRDGFTCETTGEVWSEGWYVQRSGAFYPVDRAIYMKGFQGYRYAPASWRN